MGSHLVTEDEPCSTFAKTRVTRDQERSGDRLSATKSVVLPNTKSFATLGRRNGSELDESIVNHESGETYAGKTSIPRRYEVF